MTTNATPTFLKKDFLMDLPPEAAGTYRNEPIEDPIATKLHNKIFSPRQEKVQLDTEKLQDDKFLNILKVYNMGDQYKTIQEKVEKRLPAANATNMNILMNHYR